MKGRNHELFSASMGSPPRRGEVYSLRLDPVEGSEQRGTRSAVVVSRDAINQASPVIVVCPLTGRAECLSALSQ